MIQRKRKSLLFERLSSNRRDFLWFRFSVWEGVLHPSDVLLQCDLSRRAIVPEGVKPLLSEIVRVLRAVCAAFLPMHNRLKQLELDYDRERSRSSSLTHRLHAAAMENKALQKIAEDFERVKQALGAHEINRILEASRRRTMEERRRKRREERDLPLSGR